ncbi:hypothetical protein O0L34_g5293 [Tuta absoluta]|nr:hypothetical protein O0L34_g5293 [Tuta absoluta]
MSGVLLEDKEFLKSQRKDRMSSSMSGADKVFASKTQTKRSKENKIQSFKNKHYKDIAEMNKIVTLEASTSSSSSPSDEEVIFSPPAMKNSRSSSVKPLDQTLTSTWDRALQLSTRQASTSFIAAAKMPWPRCYSNFRVSILRL